MPSAAPKNAKEEKVQAAADDFMKAMPEEKAKEAEDDKFAKADLAAKVGDQQERQEKIEKAAAANTHTTSEVWTANMPAQYLAQHKAKQEAEEEEESEEESEEEEKEADDEDEDTDDSDDDDDVQ